MSWSSFSRSCPGPGGIGVISRNGGEISKWTTGDRPLYIALTGLGCVVPWAEALLRRARDANATPPRQRSTPIRARRVKKADWERGLVFIWDSLSIWVGDER